MRYFPRRLLGRCFYVSLAAKLLILCYYGAKMGLFDDQLTSRALSFLSSPPLIQGGADADPDIRLKRDHVKRMMKHAWDGYVKYAWGANELRPISRKPHNDSIFGSAPLGATIVDSLDTLFIMDMMDEFKVARAWVQDHMSIDKANIQLSLFEINIRLVGGFLSIFALTGDVLFRERAQQVAEKLLPAFDNSTGIPNGRINLSNGKSSGGWPVLAEWGTLSLEFNYLSDVTGSGEFAYRIHRIYQTINSMEGMDGLYPVNIRMRQNRTTIRTNHRVRWTQFDQYTLGAAGDSFYEYLLKSWLQSGRTDSQSLSLYLRAVDGAVAKLIHRSEHSNLTYLAQFEYGHVEPTMGHLACFAGGMFALGGKSLGIDRHVELGAALTATCHQSYVRTPTQLGPEVFHFSGDFEAEAEKSDGTNYYILRPEVIESYLILWRITHDQRYRQWGWEAVLAIEKHCRVKTGGYSGLKNVNIENPIKDDVQQSFFLAETLKYLYLLFSDDSLISLDEWVFNTEAHPLPIKGGVNLFYRPAAIQKQN